MAYGFLIKAWVRKDGEECWKVDVSIAMNLVLGACQRAWNLLDWGL
ncbi:MAG: hypothetical protein ACUVQY_04820 [Thermoproteota archaeon]